MTYSVLVVDDHPGMRLLLRRLLDKDPRFEWVGEAENGFEGVLLAQSLNPDAVILDISMPLLDGGEALPLIRESSPKTKIVVLSSFAAEMERRAQVDTPADAYVDKSGSIEIVLDRIIDLTEGPGGRTS